ncbi:MAG: Ig-like domain-containing protein [Leptospiraceae bacterium]|nr:Ig-like domain-containing protein [Leptospiraceae bacterium]
MKKIIYLLVTALLFTAGCSKKEKKYLPFSSNNSTGAPLQSDSPATNVTGATLSQIRVTPADQSIAKNTHANYIATAVYSDGTTKNISTESTWTVKSETDKVSTVASKKGRFLGSTATSAGTPAKVSAAFGSISGDANLTVTNAGLTSIQITSVPSLVPGGTAQYVATGIFSDGTRQDISSLVSWSSSATNSVAIDSTTGVGTGGTTAATATITATLITPANFPTVTNGGAATTTTQLNAKIVSITVTGVATLGAGSTTNYVASAIYDDGTSSDITTQATWSLSSSANAVVSDAEGSKGFFTAVNAGSVNVQATYIGVTGSKAVTINSLTVSSVTVSPSTKTIAKGTTTQFTATATYSDGSTADVTKTAVWTSSNTSFGTVDTSSTTGGIARGIAAGAATITAAIGGKSANASLTVTSATLVSISIGNGINSGTGLPASAGPFTIAKGTTKKFFAVGVYSDGSKQDITDLVSWTSGSPSQVNVGNSTGSIGLATGLSQGSSTITASFPDSNGNMVTSNASTLNISAATLNSIAIGLNTNVGVGATKQYTATGTFSDNTTQDITVLVTWRSETTANATISNAVSDKGLAYGLVAGTSNITAILSNGSNGIATNGGGVITSNTSVLTITTTPTTTTTTNSVVSGYNVTVPSGMATGTTPSGDFSGITYQGSPAEVAGFVSTVNYTGTAGCTNFGSSLLTAMINDSPDKIIVNNQISSNVIGTNPDCSAVYILAVTTNANMTVTQLSNHLIEEIGKTVPGGTISNLPVSACSESPTTTFRVVLQATYSSTGNELVGVGVSREADYANNAALLASLLDGTNINPTTSTNLSKTDSFTATADPKVDFVWVVDNSGSMSTEQASVVTNASTFFDKLNTKRIDFRLGVIATGSTGTNQCEMNAQNKAWALWGTGWTTSANGATAFSNNVSSVGTSGCGTDETGIFFMERALGVHTGEAATIVPRPGAKLIFVILSDEGDGYTTMANKSGANAPSTTFNTASNTFVTNGYKVYNVIGIHDGSQVNAGIDIGKPGKCTGAGSTAADNANNTDTKYFNLALATGGSSSTICSDNYTAILDNIATQAAGSASIYVLTKTPISSTIVVKKNGTAVTQDATNGWAYNSATKTIVFSGTAYPTAGDAVTVEYQYNSSVNVASAKISDGNLLAYVSKTASNGTARGTAAAIALLVGAILAGRIWKNRKHS